jgi:hypothetical protein
MTVLSRRGELRAYGAGLGSHKKRGIPRRSQFHYPNSRRNYIHTYNVYEDGSKHGACYSATVGWVFLGSHHRVAT